MKAFKLDVEIPTGAILIGGYSALPAGASLAHAVDHNYRPVIPATALRGALRESAEAIIRGVGRPACDGGSGVELGSGLVGETPSPRPCTVDGGARCIPCRLFGTQSEGLMPGARVFSSLIIGDGVLDDDEPVTWTDRQHVAVSRSHRSAEENRLFLRRTPDLINRRLVARGYTVEPEFDRYFEAAVRATTHIGSGRSVGLGRVVLDLEWLDAVPQASPPSAQAVAGCDLAIRVTLQSPAALGGPQAGDNYRHSRAEVPGSALRGAVGFALARTTAEIGSDPRFVELMDEDGGAQFGFLYPVEGDNQGGDDALPGPWPITARACKIHGGEHGVIDTLLDRIIGATISDAAQAAAAHKTMLRHCMVDLNSGGLANARCGAPLRGASGSRRHAGEPEKRVVTRLCLDRRSTSAREGALFSNELLESGTVFEGTIRNVPEHAQPLLASALRLPIHVGRGTSAGWGRVSVEVVERRPRRLLERREANFVHAARERFEAAKLPLTGAENLLPISFLAPFLPDSGDEDGRRTLEREIGAVADWLVVARRFSRDGGWDQRTGRPIAELAVAAGAVYVARLEDGRDRRATLELLHTLERRGVGRRRHQGYGELLFFDPFILNRSQAPVIHNELHQRLRPLRRELVLAAEAVIDAAFAKGADALLPAKTQFSRLVNLCGEASCSEEIENYLRYQAGRDSGGVKSKFMKEAWQIDFVDAVIGAVQKVLLEHAGDGGGRSEEEDDMWRVEAWRLYTMYLARSYTYKACKQPMQRPREKHERKRGQP